MTTSFDFYTHTSRKHPNNDSLQFFFSTTAFNRFEQNIQSHD
jgi:hypothetical protein